VITKRNMEREEIYLMKDGKQDMSLMKNSNKIR
jgi:hypothetical protein